MTVVVDVLILLACTMVALAGRAHLPFFHPANDLNHPANDVKEYTWLVSVLVISGWLFMNVAFGTYGRRVLGVGTLEYKRVLAAAAAAGGAVGIVCFLARYPLSRGYFVIMFAVGGPTLVLARFVLRRSLQSVRRRGHLLTRVLLVGTPIHIDQVAQVLKRERWLGYTIVGALTPPSFEAAETAAGVPVVGHTDRLLTAIGDQQVDTLVFAEGSFANAAEFRRTAWDLEEHHVQMIVVPGLTDVAADRIQVRPVGGLPLVFVERPQGAAAVNGMKRAFDIACASALLLLLAPVMGMVALLVRLEDGGPVLFRQARVGRDNTLFQCLKFRSMVVDADEQFSSIAHLNETGGVLFKMAEDPRITRVGRAIRRLSLDELPQLWNVVRGEMSMVGPRPALPVEVARYDSDMRRRLRVRPGVTGLWQVSGRSDLSWEDTVRLDLYYVDNWSVVQDVAILLKTVRAVFRSEGAY
jgi:exopolysaccharide biosynthesis polyprenyl glycosylphosphotransferase